MRFNRFASTLRGGIFLLSALGTACGGGSAGPDDGGSPGRDGQGVTPVADGGHAGDGGHTPVPDAGRDASVKEGSVATDGATPGTGIHASGNKLVDGSGGAVELRGVDLNGTEYMCAQGRGIFDSPISLASASAMVSWGINVVRIGLNEDCWLGINGVMTAYAGSNYQTAFEGAVATLTKAGLAVMIELHWNSVGTALALGQEPMPDAAHSPTMWQQVAVAFKDNGLVIFDLYNEPVLTQGLTDAAGNSYSGLSEADAWDCWKNGQSTTNDCGGFPAVGMQSLVNTVRTAGANNLITLGGVAYSNDLTAWPANVPTDPAKNLAASFHGYGDGTNEYFVTGTPSSNPTANVNSMLGAVLTAGYPVVIGEFGSSTMGTGTFAQTDLTNLMTWADTNNVGYLAFSWVHYGFELVDLITDYTSFDAASPWGTFYKGWLAAH
jgi:endoglucanase